MFTADYPITRWFRYSKRMRGGVEKHSGSNLAAGEAGKWIGQLTPSNYFRFPEKKAAHTENGRRKEKCCLGQGLGLSVATVTAEDSIKQNCCFPSSPWRPDFRFRSTNLGKASQINHTPPWKWRKSSIRFSHVHVKPCGCGKQETKFPSFVTVSYYFNMSSIRH